MTFGKGQLVLTAFAAALLAGGGTFFMMSAAAPVDVSDKAAVERIVRDYILANPEILTQAMENLEARAMKAVVDANRKVIETPFAGAWEGAADADVTLVQFFDYSCSYCRASLADIDRLLAEDSKLRVVYREMPILGQPSLDAARASLAVAREGRYGVFHRALYAGGRVTPASIEAARRKAGIDATRARSAEASREIEQEIAANLELQAALQITGTPSWVVGDRILNGAVGYQALREAIASARERKGG